MPTTRLSFSPGAATVGGPIPRVLQHPPAASWLPPAGTPASPDGADAHSERVDGTVNTITELDKLK